MVGGVEVDAVVGAWGDDVLAVEVGATESGGEGFVVMGELATAGRAVEDFGGEVGEVRHVADGWWADEEELWGLIAGAGGVGEDEAGENSGTGGDFARRSVEDGFQVVGAEHEDDDVDGFVTFEAGGKVVEAFAGDVEGIFVDGGAAILAFFDDAEVGSEFAGEDTGPADVEGVADGEGSGDAGGVKAPCVGVAEAEDGFHGRGIDRAIVWKFPDGNVDESLGCAWGL